MSFFKQYSGNSVKFLFYQILFSVGYMFVSGAVLQTFLINLGLNESVICNYNAAIQFVQILAIFAMAVFADRCKRIVRFFSSTVLSVSVISLALFLCIFMRSDSRAVMTIVFACSIFANLALGIRMAVCYQFVYQVTDKENLGKLIAISSAVAGVSSFGVSLVLSILIINLDYYAVMSGCFVFSFLCLVGSAAFARSVKAMGQEEEPTSQNLDFSAFKNPVTLKLALPNVFRGVASGIIGLITVFGFSAGILTNETSTLVSVLTQMTAFAGNILFAYTYRKMTCRKALLYASILTSVALPITVLHGNTAEFLIAYAVCYLFVTVLDVAMPTLFYEIVPYDQIGSFTSIRMVLFTLGSVLASLVCQPLAERIGYFTLFLIAAALQTVCGVIHYVVAKRMAREKNEVFSEAEPICSDKQFSA